MQSLQAFNLRQWIDANRAQLRPPVGNKRVFRDGDFIINVLTRLRLCTADGRVDIAI